MRSGKRLDNSSLGTLDIARVGGKYRVKEMIGSGSFGAWWFNLTFCVEFYNLPRSITGTVYHGINIVSKQDVAIKLEAVDVEHSHVEHEYQLYRSLAGGIGIPSVYWFGSECEYDVLVLERLGPSLGDLFNRCNRKFTLKTVLLLADQLVSFENCITCRVLY